MIENLGKLGTNDGLRKITAVTDVSKSGSWRSMVGCIEACQGMEFLPGVYLHGTPR